MPPAPRAQDTAARLAAAAMHEFEQFGFHGTDTNKIARRAGFAPQTFYRWYRDKTEAFIAAYAQWETEERAVLQALAAAGASGQAMAAAIIQHHRQHRLFRRSLRHLAVEHPAVRQARAASRERQASHILATRPDLRRESILITLLQIERLADAAAEDECQDIALPESLLIETIASLLEGLI